MINRGMEFWISNFETTKMNGTSFDDDPHNTFFPWARGCHRSVASLLSGFKSMVCFASTPKKIQENRQTASKIIKRQKSSTLEKSNKTNQNRKKGKGHQTSSKSDETDLPCLGFLPTSWSCPGLWREGNWFRFHRWSSRTWFRLGQRLD